MDLHKVAMEHRKAIRQAAALERTLTSLPHIAGCGVLLNALHNSLDDLQLVALRSIAERGSATLTDVVEMRSIFAS